MAVRSRFGALQERQFRLLWLGRTASSIGDGLIPVALAFAVIEETGSATDLGLVLAAFSVARVSLIVVGGVWADRLPRRLVMVTADLARVASQAFAAVVLITDIVEIWHLALAAAVAGGAQAFFNPASTGFVPATVSGGRLQQANALLATTSQAAELIGPAVSGLLVAAVGPGWVFAIDAASFAVSAAFLAAIRVPESRPAERNAFVREVAGGIKEIGQRSWLAASLASFALSNVAIATYYVLGPLVVERELGGARDWGLVLAGGGIGGLAGGILAVRYRPERPLLAGNLIMLLAPIALLTLVPPLPTLGLAVGLGLMFAAISFFNAVWETVLQEEIPRRALSRVSSLDAAVSFVFMPLGFTLAGPLAEVLGLDPTLGLAAALSAAAILLPLSFASVRGLTRSPSPAFGSAGESPAPVPLDPLP